MIKIAEDIKVNVSTTNGIVFERGKRVADCVVIVEGERDE